MAEIFTVVEVADLLGCHHCNVRRLFTRGVLPEPVRLNGRFVIPKRLIKRIRAELVKRGVVKEEVAAP